MPNRLVALVLIPLVFSTLSCSLFASSTEHINVSPSHPSADVYVDGNLIGKGPQSVQLSKSSTHSVMVKCGTSAGTGTIERKMSTTGVLDIIGGFLILIPFFGLLSGGAWELTPSTLSVAIPDASKCE